MPNPHTIAVAGKGGVGKTTTCGMIIDYLSRQHKGPILVVDADANSNLNEVLGVEESVTLGQIREEMAQAELKGTIPGGMTKADMYALGLSGTPESAKLRLRLLKRLELPERMTPNAMLDVLNALYSHGELAPLLTELKAEKEEKP